jgi:hypothetical protein
VRAHRGAGENRPRDQNRGKVRPTCLRGSAGYTTAELDYFVGVSRRTKVMDIAAARMATTYASGREEA